MYREGFCGYNKEITVEILSPYELKKNWSGHEDMRLVSPVFNVHAICGSVFYIHYCRYSRRHNLQWTLDPTVRFSRYQNGPVDKGIKNVPTIS